MKNEMKNPQNKSMIIRLTNNEIWLFRDSIFAIK